MTKRLFSLVILTAITLEVWADDVTTISSQTLWTFDNYSGQTTKVYNYTNGGSKGTGLFLHSTQTGSEGAYTYVDFDVNSDHAASTSGTFSDAASTSWSSSKVLTCKRGVNTSETYFLGLGNINASNTTNRANASLAFNYSKAGKLYVIYGATSATSGKFYIMQRESSSTAFTTLYDQNMPGIDYAGPLGTRSDNYNYTQVEAAVNLSGSGTVYIGGSQPYCIYAILFIPTEIEPSEIASVFLTAGQSNTAGRAMNADLPDYIKTLGTNNSGAYQYCNWSYTNGTTRKSEAEGVFRKFWPEMESSSNNGRFAYDAIVYYWIEQALQKDFYVVKHAAGGTSIDPTCTSTNDYHWSADATWLSEHASCNTNGTSMLKAFCDNIGASIDAIVATGKTPDVKAMIWHQGESDRSGDAPANYKNNLKAVIKYVRDYLVNKTGQSKYATLDIIAGTVPSNSKQYNAKVRQALTELASEDSHFHVIETNPGTFIGDQLHFDTNCAERLGIGMYNKMVGLGLVSGTKQTVPDVIYPAGQPITLDFKTWATENVGANTVYKNITLSSEAMSTIDGQTQIYKAIGSDGSGDFSEFAESFALADNKTSGNDKVRIRGSVGLQLTSNQTTTFSILNLQPGYGVTITFGAGSSGVTTLATLSENIFLSTDETQTVLAKGTALTSKTATYVVKTGTQIDLTFGSTGGHFINSIVIEPNKVEILPTKPAVTLTTDGDESKVYTVSFLEGETLHYTSPSHDGEQTVAYSTDNNGSVEITVSTSGNLECWTTRGSSTIESTHNTVAITISSGDEPTTSIVVHTIGDSTMSSYDQSIPAQAGMDGWGDYLKDCMKTEWVTVYNWADRGETAKSYYNGIWSKTSSDRPEFAEPIANKVKPGDYVIIQFGHNDSKAYSTVKYEEWLGTLVDAIKAKGATPIMASSICRARFDSNGKITRLGRIDTYEDSNRISESGASIDDKTFDYPYHAQQIATAKGIEFIDVTSGVKEMFEAYGETKTKALFPSGEKTHTNKLGAQLIAKVAAKLLLGTALQNYVNQETLALPTADEIAPIIDNFGTEDVVTKKTIWTFNDQTAGDAIADGTNSVVNRNGLYVRGGATGRMISAAASSLSSVTFSDGTVQAITNVAQTAGANTSDANAIGQNTAGRSAANALAPTFALNIGTPGTFYAIMAPTKTASDRYMRLLFSGVEKVSIAVNDAYAADNHLCELKYHAETTGVIYLSAGIASNLYAAMFVPDMEAGTEEDWNYQMVKTRENGYWTYTNMSGNNQSVPEGLTAYAVTNINSDGKAILAEYGNVIPNGAAVMVKGEPDTEYAFGSTTDLGTYTGDNLLFPNTELRYLPASVGTLTNYYFDGIKFVKATGGETIHEKQAYLSVSATADEIPLYTPEPVVTPPYGTYDFRKFAVENVSANTDKIEAVKDTNGILTGSFTTTAEGVTITGSMTLNDAFSATGAKAANVKMRKNSSSLTSTTSGLFINKSQATLNLLKLKAGDWFKIEYEGGLTFASTNVKKQGSTAAVAVGEDIVSGEVYVVQSGIEVNLNFGNSTIASYIFTVTISEDAMTPSVSFKEVTTDGKAVYTITSLDGNALRYTLNGGEEQKPTGTSVDLTLAEKTTLKAWAVNSSNTPGLAAEVDLLSTPVVLSEGIFDFKNKLSSLTSNVSLAVEGEAVTTITDGENSIPLYMPNISQAATFAGQFAFSKPGTTNTALRSNQFHINTNETNKTFYMAVLNAPVGKKLMLIDGNKEVSKVYVGTKELAYGTSHKIMSEDLTDGNLILKFDLNGGSAQIQSISLSDPVATVTGDWYISPDGNDNNPGTREAPLKTLKKAQEKAQSGNTIAILPGTYKVTNAEYMDKTGSTWNIVFNLDKKNVSYIGEVGSDGKRPIFDFNGVTPEDGKRITGFYLKTSNIIIKNIETIGIQIPTSTSNVQSENFRLNGASDCLIKNVSAHHGKGVGFYIVGSSKNNTIEDCDAYENIDDINGINSKGQPAGENNDGFGCHVSENCPGNKFVRCRAWYNADDGFDFIRCYSEATIEDCIAYKNGYATYNNTVTGETKLAKSGNGNGFKAGGYGMNNDETGKAHPMHVVTGCIAVDQPHGFYANHHLGGLKFENNRAYKNNVDYLMTNRKGEGTSTSDLTDVPGYNHELTGNISYGNTAIETIVSDIDTESCTLAGNSFSYSNGEWTNKSYETDDFVSLKVSDLLLDRDSEGNLPEAVFNFMKLKNAGEIIEDPTITLKSADETKTVYTVSYPTGTELHYRLPGSSKEQTASTSSTSEEKNISDIEVTTAGTLQVWAVKNTSSSSVVKQSVLLLAPVVHDFANVTSNIKADDGTKVRVMTYKDHNDKNQRDKDFWYVMDEDTRLRVLIFNASGKFTQGTGLSLTKANRPVAIEGVKAGDFVRIFHNGGTLLDGNAESIGTTITDASGNAITGGIESGQLIKIKVTTGNPDDYVMFQSTTENFTITKVVINKATEPTVEKDETKSNDSKWIYNVSFLEGETLHYTSPDVNGEQTIAYNGNPVTIEVANTGKLVCWTTLDNRTSENVTKTIDKVDMPAEITIKEGYQTYYAEKALDFNDISTDVMRAYIVKTTSTAAATRATTRGTSASQLELVEVKKVPAKTALILWGKKAGTIEVPQAEQTTVVITQVDNKEVNATVNLLKKAEKTESADANETIFVPNTDGTLSFDYSSFVTRGGIYIEIPTSIVGEDAKEITIGEPQEDGTIVPLETAVATVKNITPVLDTENSSKTKKVYIFKYDSSLKLYYKRPGQDTEFRGQSYKDGFESSGFTVNSTYNGYLEYYVVKNGESSRTEAKEIMLAPKATMSKIETSSATYQIDFFDGATLYYTLGDDTEKTVDTGSPLELTMTKGAKITAYSKTSSETTESLSTNLYAPTPVIVNDSVYQFADIKNEIGIDYVLNSVGFKDDPIEIDGISLKVPNALTSQTLDRFAFSAPRADGKGETSDWRLLNAGRLRAAKSEVDKHLLIQNAKKGNMLLLTYSGGPTISYVASSSTAKLSDDVTSITSNQKYEVTSDGDILLKIPADANNNCDITVISLSSQYNNSSSGGSSSSSSSEDKKTSSTAVTIGFYQLENDTTAIWRFEWEKGRELHYILEAEGTEQLGGTSGIYDLLVSKGDKVQAWTILGNDTSKVVTANLLPPTREMAIVGNYDFAENSEDLFADVPVALDMDRKVIVEGQTLYMPTALTYQTFKDKFAFSEFPKTSTLRIRKNRTLYFAKGEDVKMGILNLKRGDIVAFDFTGSIQILNGDAVKEESINSRTRGTGQGMISGTSYVMQKDGELLLNIMLSDSTVIINKMFVGEAPGNSTSKVIDFITAGEEFEALEFGTQNNVYIRDKESARQFRWLINDSRELPIDYKLSTESGEGAISNSGLTAANRRVAIHNLGAGDKIKLRFSSGGVIYEGHETNGNIVSVDGKQLVPGDSLRTGDVITVDKVNYLYNYVVLKLDSKASVSGIYINAEEVEKVWMPTIVDKGSNTIQITAGQSSLGNQVTTCYTTDGSEPTRMNGTSGPYDEFDVQLLGGGLVTIKAISYTDGGIYSKVAELTIFADELLGSSGKSNTRGMTGTYDMQGNKVEMMQPGRLYIRDGKVVFFSTERK